MKISIRKFESKDIPKKVEWINNSENNKYLHYDIPLKIEKTEKWFEKNKDRTEGINLWNKLYHRADDAMFTVFYFPQITKPKEKYVKLKKMPEEEMPYDKKTTLNRNTGSYDCRTASCRHICRFRRSQ